ncbi:MAG: aminoacyl-tRNA hydrolase [Actinomycetota bacterium]
MNPAADAWLVVGLGNPGTRYDATRHNAGARTVEALARRLGLKLKSARRAPAFVAEGRIGDAQIMLTKPKTFMNDSGRAVASLVHARDISPDNLVIVHDDIDLTPGSLKIKFGGGAAGQRGVESVVRSLGTKDFFRVRIGVGRGPHFQQPSKFVLERIPKDAIEHHLEQEARAADAVVTLIEDGLAAAQNQFNFVAEPEL